MNESFASFYHRLDATIIGVLAFNPATDLIHGLDGSIVVCDSPEAMNQWLIAHGLEDHSEIDFLFYEDIIDDMCKEGISYHLDAGASDHLLATLKQDQRFHPEVLHHTDDDWTLFTSCFDPYSDDLDELRTAINGYVLGYMENEADTLAVTGQPQSSDASPLTYRNYGRLAISADRLHRLPTQRLASLEFWLWMLKEYDV